MKFERWIATNESELQWTNWTGVITEITEVVDTDDGRSN